MDCPICQNSLPEYSLDDSIGECPSCGAPVHISHKQLSEGDWQQLKMRWEKWGRKSWRQLSRKVAVPNSPENPILESINDNVTSTVGRVDKWLSTNKAASRWAERLSAATLGLKKDAIDQQQVNEADTHLASDRLSQVTLELETKRKTVNHLASDQKPLAISQKDFADLYNQNLFESLNALTAVDQTETSMKRYVQRISGPIQMQFDRNGKYWVINSGETEKNVPIYYLVLRKDIRLNQLRLTTVEACFDFENKPTPNGSFDLVMPAILKPSQGQQIWELSERGVLVFKDVEEEVI